MVRNNLYRHDDAQQVPVIELAHLSPTQKRAYVIADNRLALDAGWNEELLALELADLTEAGYDLALYMTQTPRELDIEKRVAVHVLALDRLALAAKL